METLLGHLNKEEAARQQKVLEQARERFQELAEAEEKYISANIENRAEALAAVEGMMRELELTQSQYEAIRDALIAQNVISAAAGQAYAGAWEDLLYGDLAEYGVGYAPVLGNIYFAKKRKEAAASQAGTASGGVAAGGALPPGKEPGDDKEAEGKFNTDEYYKKGLKEVPDDWIEVEAPEELKIKSESFKDFLRQQGYDPKNWRKVVEKWASPDGTIYQRNYWTNGTDYYYHGDGIEEFFPH